MKNKWYTIIGMWKITLILVMSQNPAVQAFVVSNIPTPGFCFVGGAIMNDEHIIYGLIDPRTDEVRYIGKSSRGLRRCGEHIYPCSLKRKSINNNWIKSLLSKGLKPKIIVIEITDRDNIDEAERAQIAIYRKLGVNLNNMTDGGTGGNTGGQAGYKPRSVLARCLTTQEEREYPAVQSTKRDGFGPPHVSAVCNGGRISHKGWIFRYKDGTSPKRKKSKCVQSINVLDVVVNKRYWFNTIKDAALVWGVIPNSITCHLKVAGKRPYLGRYIISRIGKRIRKPRRG